MDEVPRLFTVEQARSLLPDLRPLLLSMREQKRKLDNLHADMENISPAMATNGHATRVTEIELAMAELIEGLQSAIGKISDLGVELKDIDLGLVDFPSLREDRIVYLCWTVDEADIAFWHELDAGVAGRQPL
jgi:hypothetical protein